MTRVPRQAGGARQVALAIPTAQEIHAIVASLPTAPLSERRYVPGIPGRGGELFHEGGPRRFLQVTTGAVRVFRTDPARAARAAEDRERKRREWEVAEGYRRKQASLGLLPAFESVEPMSTPTGRVITEWSRASRARMELSMGSLDYELLFVDGREPVMVTLTMPGILWEAAAPSPRDFKRMVNLWQRVYARHWGEAPVGVWKLEFQRRGAPHLHILMTPPVGVAKSRDRLEFKPWLSREWAKIVRGQLARLSPIDPAVLESASMAHELAGTRVEAESASYSDPKRIAQYFRKHSSWSAKDYQNQMPPVWLTALERGGKGARFWGVWGLNYGGGTIELDQQNRGNAPESSIMSDH